MGDVAIAGTSSSVDYPVTDGSTLTLGSNGTTVNDAAVTEIDAAGAKLVYSTLFGGNGQRRLAKFRRHRDGFGWRHLCGDGYSVNESDHSAGGDDNGAGDRFSPCMEEEARTGFWRCSSLW